MGEVHRDSSRPTSHRENASHDGHDGNAKVQEALQQPRARGEREKGDASQGRREGARVHGAVQQ